MSRHNGPRQRWSEDDIAWLTALWPDTPSALVAEALGRRLAQCYGMAHKLGLKKSAEYLAGPDACRLRRDDHPGSAYRYQSGHKPWNTGLKGWTAGGRSAETRFKKGNRTGRARAVYQPIGAERISKDGYLQRKVNDDFPLQRRWKGVHLIVWEERHGPVPKGYKVFFVNGDKRDIRIGNLALISDADNMRRNSLHNQPREIRQLIQLRGALNRKINARSKNA